MDGKEGPFLVWETMEFCGEDCLRRYQSVLGSHCAHCVVAVNQLSLGKYCVRFGADIRQFCSGKCLEEFKRGLKVGDSASWPSGRRRGSLDDGRQASRSDKLQRGMVNP